MWPLMITLSSNFYLTDPYKSIVYGNGTAQISIVNPTVSSFSLPTLFKIVFKIKISPHAEKKPLFVFTTLNVE